MIDAYASEPQYVAHVAPVFDALPASVRGAWSRDGDGPVIVSSYNDLRAVGERDVIFMEHGAGQTYGDGLVSYASGPFRENVRLFLCPNERVAGRNRRSYPGTPSVVVGTPKLDIWNGTHRPGLGIVGLAFHWDAEVVPEARTALPYYAESFPTLAARYPMIATAHPRIWATASDLFAEAGVFRTSVADLIFGLCDVLVVDNSSIGWEFLSLDRPVVWLNAPWYRRDMEYGLRFWEYADAGLQVDGPDELPDVIDAALEDGESERRREVADVLYPYRDGRSAGRAAGAILERFALGEDAWTLQHGGERTTGAD